MLRYFAQGAAMAMEVRCALAACARAEGDFPAAFQRYQALRLLPLREWNLLRGLGLLFHASG
jgi:hypothetical protein